MSFLDIFTGGASSAVSVVGKVANGVMDRFWPKKMSEKEKAEIFLNRIDKDIDREKMSLKDIADARKMFMVEMQTQKQPWIIRIMLGMLRPVAGFCALWVAFYPYFRVLFNSMFSSDLPVVEISDTKFYAIIAVVATIIAFFFGSAHKGGMSSPDRKPGE